jgi:peptide chain release factor 3
MKIEQQRGISVTSSVMTFEHEGVTFNLLDTPGHEDFSEDTYRTLTAVDSAVMVIDAAKGIEPQTRKLFEVCRIRNVPIITFVNKVDREGKEPFELLDEIADVLQLDVCPMSWPVGMGGTFEGIYEFARNRLYRPAKTDSGISRASGRSFRPRRSQAGAGDLAGRACQAPRGGLARGRRLSQLRFRGLSGRRPYSGLLRFGAEGIRRCRDDRGARRARAVAAATALRLRSVDPDHSAVTGFIFKVQANMNPQHRDRVAFMRLCSGKFRRGMKLLQPSTGKSIAVHSPILFFAQNRELADEAYPATSSAFRTTARSGSETR